jgi:purine catabolism regulator
MITVADAIQIPQFSGARLVAGHAGAGHRVAWVHAVGVPDAPDWLNGGELVLTTPINLPTSPEAQAAYIAAMAEKAVAGLALAVGRYLDAAPDALKAAADQYGFPLIEVPYIARFVDIARAVNERITQEQMAATERALHINRVLTELVLEGGNLNALAETLAALVGQSISIENDRFEGLANCQVGTVDEARRYTLREGHTDPRLIRALGDDGVFERIRQTGRPVHLPQMPAVGLELERILAPIIVHGDLYGYMWIIADDRPLSDLDRMAIEIGATVAALMLLYQEAAASAEASLKGGLLAQLIAGDDAGTLEAGAGEGVRVEGALRYGVNLNAPFLLFVVEPAGGYAEQAGRWAMTAYRRIQRAVAAVHGRALVAQFAGQVVVLAQSAAPGDDAPGPAPGADGQTARIHAAIAAAGADLGEPTRAAAVSAPGGAAHVRAAYARARDTLTIAARLHPSAAALDFSALGYLHTLYQAGPAALRANPHAPIVRHLRAEGGPELFRTLEVYLDEGSSGVQTAEALAIHRSTLNYRLERIGQITRCDLSEPATRTNLQIAIKLLRLFEIGADPS